MGFATANLELPAMMQVLGEAVYAAYVTVEGVRYKAAMSVGVAPTFEQATATCEVHILDFAGEIYGKLIEVEPVEYLRPMIKFESVEEPDCNRERQYCLGAREFVSPTPSQVLQNL